MTNGWVEVEAEDEIEAYGIVDTYAGWELELVAEWGSCGDTDEYEVFMDVEEVYQPSVSDDLWK